MIGALFRKDRVRSQAETLYAAIADQARAPDLYALCGAPDTPEGRFDMLALHMVLAIDRLRRDAPATDRLVRLVQEIFFESLDSALREMGVGDLSVGRKMRGLAEAFYGRYSAYDQAGTSDALEAAIARNALGSDDPMAARRLAGYFRQAQSALADASADDLPDAIRRLAALSREVGEARHAT